MNKEQLKQLTRQRRKIRIRSVIKGTVKKPRLSIFRSLNHLSVQLIDDDKGKTLVSVSDREIKGKSKKKPLEVALLLGQLVAKKCLDIKIEKIVFDRSGYKYHGRVKAVAEGAREGGLKF